MRIITNIQLILAICGLYMASQTLGGIAENYKPGKNAAPITEANAQRIYDNFKNNQIVSVRQNKKLMAFARQKANTMLRTGKLGEYQRQLKQLEVRSAAMNRRR